MPVSCPCARRGHSLPTVVLGESNSGGWRRTPSFPPESFLQSRHMRCVSSLFHPPCRGPPSCTGPAALIELKLPQPSRLSRPRENHQLCDPGRLLPRQYRLPTAEPSSDRD